jgi:hypothetical protein
MHGSEAAIVFAASIAPFVLWTEICLSGPRS